MKHINQLFLLGIVSIILLGGCASSDISLSESNQDEVINRIPVKVAVAEKATLYETVLTLGDISASAVYRVLSGRGTVEEIFVEAGDVVEKDQVLFKLDKRNLQNSYNSIESQLRTIRDNLKIQRDDQQSYYDKQKQLFEAGAVSQSEIDRAEVSLNQIEKQYKDAAINYSNQINNLRDGLNDREIKSPISGKVASVSIIENQEVNDLVAIEVIDDSSMILNTNVTADQINRMNLGDKAFVYPDGDRRKEVIGIVTVLNEIPNMNTGLYNVELQLEDSNYMLRTGEFAEVETFIDERTAVVIPKKAVRRIGDKEYVFVAKETIAIQREVITGAVQGEHMEIVTGIASGEEVVVRGQSFLKDQTDIEIIE